MAEALPATTKSPNTRINSKIEVQRSEIQGWGLFALEDIDEGDWIWKDLEYNKPDNPNLYTTDRLHELTQDQLHHQTWQFEDGKYLLVHLDDPNYYHNHSCDPNTWYTGNHIMVARRPIKKGEEVTYDYAMSESGYAFEMLWDNCQCGASLCRKQVACNDWQRPELQQRYGDHFLPYILEKIKAQSFVTMDEENS